MSDLPKRHEGIRLDPSAGVLDIPSAGQEEHIRRYKAPRAVHPSPDETDNPALDFEPEHVPRPEKNQIFPPIVTIDGRVDTDIDHLMADDDDGDLILTRDYPRPHVFSVIQGTIDDDVDALANHDGTMEHTLVDSPKQFSSKNLHDVASKGGRRKSPGRPALDKSPIRGLPSPGMSRSLMPTDRSHNKQRADFSDDDDDDDRDFARDTPPPSPSASRESHRQNANATRKSNTRTPTSSSGSQKSDDLLNKPKTRPRKKRGRGNCDMSDSKWMVDNMDLSNGLQVQSCDHTSNFRRIDSCSSCNTVTRIDEMICPIDGMKGHGAEIIKKDKSAVLDNDQIYMSKLEKRDIQQCLPAEDRTDKSQLSTDAVQPPPAPAPSTLSNKHVLSKDAGREWLDRVRTIISDDGFGFRPPRHLLLQKADRNVLTKADSLSRIQNHDASISDNDFARSDTLDHSLVIKHSARSDNDILSEIKQYERKKANSCSTLSDSGTVVEDSNVRLTTSLVKASSVSQAWEKCNRFNAVKPIAAPRSEDSYEIPSNDASSKSLQKYLEEVSRNPKASTICDSLKAAIKVAEQSMTAAAKVAQALSLVIEATRASKSDVSSFSADSISPKNNISTSEYSPNHTGFLARDIRDASPFESENPKEKLYLLKENQLLSYIESYSNAQNSQAKASSKRRGNRLSDKKSSQKKNAQYVDAERKLMSNAEGATHEDSTSNHKRYPIWHKKYGGTPNKNREATTRAQSRTSRSRSPAVVRYVGHMPEPCHKQPVSSRCLHLQSKPNCSSRIDSPQKPRRDQATTVKHDKAVLTCYRKVPSSDKSTTYECSCSTQTCCSTCSSHCQGKSDSDISQTSSNREYIFFKDKKNYSTGDNITLQDASNCGEGMVNKEFEIEVCRVVKRSTESGDDNKPDDLSFRPSYQTSTSESLSKPAYASPISKYFSQLVSGFNKSPEDTRDDERYASETAEGSCVDPVSCTDDRSPKPNLNTRVSQLLRKYNCSPVEFKRTGNNTEGQQKNFKRKEGQTDESKKTVSKQQNDFFINNSPAKIATRWQSPTKKERQMSPSLKNSVNKDTKSSPPLKSPTRKGRNSSPPLKSPVKKVKQTIPSWNNNVYSKSPNSVCKETDKAGSPRAQKPGQPAVAWQARHRTGPNQPEQENVPSAGDKGNKNASHCIQRRQDAQERGSADRIRYSDSPQTTSSMYLDTSADEHSDLISRKRGNMDNYKHNMTTHR